MHTVCVYGLLCVCVSASYLVVYIVYRACVCCVELCHVLCMRVCAVYTCVFELVCAYVGVCTSVCTCVLHV